MTKVLCFPERRKLFAAGRFAPTTEVLDLTIPQHDVEAFELLVDAMRIKHEMHRAVREAA
jgi:hypothetical protein